MSKIGIRQLKKELKDYKRNDLIDLIVKIYKEDKSSQNYIDQMFSTEHNANLIQSSKEKIKKSFYSSSARFNVDKAKDYLNEGLESVQSSKEKADLLLYYVECGIEAILSEEDYWDGFYNDLIHVFTLFNDEMDHLKQEEELFERVRNILVLVSGQDIDRYFKENLYQLCLSILKKSDQ